MIRGRFLQHLKKLRFRRFFTLPHSCSVFVDPYAALSDEMGGGGRKMADLNMVD